LPSFVKRYPQSGYVPSALFWLGNAQYATRDYTEAITNFRSLLTARAQPCARPGGHAGDRQLPDRAEGQPRGAQARWSR
jgi:hypothetical protein